MINSADKSSGKKSIDLRKSLGTLERKSTQRSLVAPFKPIPDKTKPAAAPVTYVQMCKDIKVKTGKRNAKWKTA